MKTIYGIPNCNKMKMIFDIFKSQGEDYVFHNYKKEGISTEKLQLWLSKYAIEELINKKGTTYKGLTDVEKDNLNLNKSAIPLIQKQTSLLRRPIVELTDGTLVLDYLDSK